MVDFQSRDTRRGLAGSDDDEDEEEDEATTEQDKEAEEEVSETVDAEPSAESTASEGSEEERASADGSATAGADEAAPEPDSDETTTPAAVVDHDAASTPRPSGDPRGSHESGEDTETTDDVQESDDGTGTSTAVQDSGGPPGSKTAAAAQAETSSSSQGVTVDAAVVTIGTTGAETDPTGDSLVSALEGAGHSVTARERLRGDHDGIQQSVDALIGRDDVDVVVTAGGTGIRDDELAIEAVHPLLEKALPGFGEAFRTLLFDHIGTGIVAVRSTAGIANGTLVFCLPGDQQAATLAAEEIIATEAGELVDHLA